MEEPVRHVAKWPWVAAVAFMVFIVLVGVYASDRARSERLEKAGSFAAATVITSTQPPSSDVPRSITPSTARAATAPPSTAAATAPPAPATACSSAVLVETVKRSGQVGEAAASTIGVERSKCVSDYAFARLTSDVGPANAYFKREGDAYRMLALGTSVDLSQYGIPTEIAAQLQ